MGLCYFCFVLHLCQCLKRVVLNLCCVFVFLSWCLTRSAFLCFTPPDDGERPDPFVVILCFIPPWYRERAHALVSSVFLCITPPDHRLMFVLWFCVSPPLNIEKGCMLVLNLCFTPTTDYGGKGGGSQCPRSRTHGVGCSWHTCEEIGEALLWSSIFDLSL